MSPRLVAQAMFTLASAALGLLAAFAWNEAGGVAVIILLALARAAARRTREGEG